MKLLIPALALSCAFAAPALAQSAPANPHAGHTHHAPQATTDVQQTCSAEHAAMGHCKQSKGSPAAPGEPSRQVHDAGCCEKDTNAKMACCEKARGAGKDCCDEAQSAPAQSGHSGH